MISIMLVSALYSQCTHVTQSSTTQSDSLFDLYSVALLIMRDCSRARDIHLAAWHVTDDSCIWPTRDGSCGYHKKGEKLIRSIGQFTSAQNIWNTRVQAQVAAGIKKIKWELDLNHGLVRGVYCTLKNQIHELSFYCFCGVVQCTW